MATFTEKTIHFSVWRVTVPLGSLSNDNGDGNENVISKYKFALF